MRHKNPEYFEAIEAYINEYMEINSGRSPSTYEIANAIGLVQSTVVKYMKVMREQGVLEYSGKRNIVTRRRKQESAETCRVPVLGEVACGIPKLAEENIEEYVKLPVSLFGHGEFFILRAKGDSMLNAGIEDGDMVLIRRQTTAEYNQIVVALIDDEATLKRFRPRDDHVCLHAENPKYEDIIVSDCSIQGVAVKVIKNLS